MILGERAYRIKKQTSFSVYGKGTFEQSFDTPPTPTPSVTPTLTPSVTPTATPELTPSATRPIINITNDTDIFAIFDTTSMTVSNGMAASTALIAWHQNIKALKPSYTGKLYMLPYNDENWVDWPREIHTKAITPNYSWGNIPTEYRVIWSTLPATVNKFVCLAFIDETTPNYHSSTAEYPSGQPTASFKTDYNNFISLYQNFQSNGYFFKGICYPIVASTAGKYFIKHAIAAMYGELLTDTTLNSIYDVSSAHPQYTTLSLLKTTNPYTSQQLGKTPPGLIHYGWKGVWNKTSPATDVFSAGTFNTELNELLS